MDYILLGKQIRKQRKLKKYTLEQLAEKVEVSTTFIGQIERGQGIPSLETLVRIVNALDVSCDSLLFDSLAQGAGNQYFLTQVANMTESFTQKQKNLVLKQIELLSAFNDNQ